GDQGQPDPGAGRAWCRVGAAPERLEDSLAQVGGGPRGGGLRHEAPAARVAARRPAGTPRPSSSTTSTALPGSGSILTQTGEPGAVYRTALASRFSAIRSTLRGAASTHVTGVRYEE